MLANGIATVANNVEPRGLAGEKCRMCELGSPGVQCQRRAGLGGSFLTDDREDGWCFFNGSLEAEPGGERDGGVEELLDGRASGGFVGEEKERLVAAVVDLDRRVLALRGDADDARAVRHALADRGGGDAVKDLLSGQVKMMFSSIAPVQEFVRDGRLLALATTGPKRDPAFPNVPTVAESGYPGFDVRLWMGVVTTGGTPKDVVKKLDDANRKAVESPDVQKTLAAQGFAPIVGSAEDFDKFYRAERDKWAKVVTSAGMDKD